MMNEKKDIKKMMIGKHAKKKKQTNLFIYAKAVSVHFAKSIASG